ncbi:MAG: molybdenum cofactor biosynthesis protein C [Sphingomonadales bacterium RIFCSPHIGHO2_01_FULL_65_20]|jgi:cyclic pyranopterin phosphate synthase|uniref:cyclic pyranopterin monophosphate synthase MoaC n=2 Tax=unclassified Blastomonas TaxID=2626550 RepID=UPI0008B8E992|nr:cyclic pyranopterin monophosphate synthase MoaC [Blastomonas sp.]MCH2238348.1 cyclic pyranopterin monophosphate synthase MoaC [Blastomonas sp.]OHC95157.1 MAG: molybdenum cofactor biosynthesis protein C [Sphingomonadales bacterium RIFCSPHIGHO2_01_FULL_65_20]
MDKLTHLDATGAAQMVDVSAKADSVREAVAEGVIAMTPAVIAAIRAGDIKKGDVLGTARIAGIMAAKQTSNLIPLCHPLPIASVSVDFAYVDTGVRVETRVRTSGKTGVEMEALTAASVALLTIYDMAKALDKAMVIGPVRLLAKSGGKSGDWTAG